MVRLLVENGTNVNEADYSGKTPLMVIASYTRPLEQHSEWARILVEEGNADVNMVDSGRQSSGLTALMFAAENKSSEILEYLLQANADPFLKSGTGMTALQLALMQDRPHNRIIESLKLRMAEMQSTAIAESFAAWENKPGNQNDIPNDVVGLIVDYAL